MRSTWVLNPHVGFHMWQLFPRRLCFSFFQSARDFFWQHFFFSHSGVINLFHKYKVKGPVPLFITQVCKIEWNCTPLWQHGDLWVPFHIWPEPTHGSQIPLAEKAACVRMKGCICWPECALSQGLGDYVDKRCTWCFRLSFSPPLPPFIPSSILLSSSPLAVSNISLGLLKD